MAENRHGIMKKQEGDATRKPGRTLFKDDKVRTRAASVDKTRSDPRMSVISSSRRDSGVETRGLSSFTRAGGSWETDWNAAATRDRGRSMSQMPGGGGSLTGKPKQMPRGRTSSLDQRMMMAAHTVQMDESRNQSFEDTDPEELLRWTTEARERDLMRQQLLDHRRKLHLDEYDPSLYRDHLVLITDFEAMAITFNVFMGATFVGLPMAYLHSGLLVGTIGVFIVAVSVSYCMHLLIYWRYEISKRLRQSWTGYPRTLEFAISQGPTLMEILAPAFKVFLHIIFIPYLIFATAIQCVFMAHALYEILKYYKASENIRTCIAIFFIPCLPLSIIPNLKIMAVVSVAGVAASFTACILIVIGILIAQRDHIISGNLVNVQPESPLYLLVALSTLQPVAQIMCIESHMINRENFLGYFGVMNRAIIVITCAYLVLASVAYSKYAEDTKDNIMDNLKMSNLEVVACIIFIFSVLFTFPVNVFTVYDFAWEVYLRRRLHGFPDIEKMLWGYAVRITVAVFVVILAIIVVGVVEIKYYVMAICLPLLILVFPPVIEICMGVKTVEMGVKSYKFWLDLIVIALGLLILVMSIYAVVITGDNIVKFK